MGVQNQPQNCTQPILSQVLEEQKTKYHNKKQEVDGIPFDSKKEAQRFKELMALLDTGEITDLKIQPQFTLVEGYKLPTGDTVKRMHYTADFSYMKDGKLIVEDVKSRATRTEPYRIRKNLMLDKYGIVIHEV